MKNKIIILLVVTFHLSTFSQNWTSLECINREFNVVVHMILDTGGKSLVTPSFVTSRLNFVSSKFAPICAKFNLCEVKYTNNYNFLDWNKSDMELEFISLFFKPRTINIVIVKELLDPSGRSGYATLAGIASRGEPIIVLKYNASSTTWVHEFGHYFGLEHTFSSPLGLANMSDCSIKDDQICDTDPDPNSNDNTPNPLLSGCEYIGTQKDPSGKFYNPLVENYMSYFTGCQSNFTHGQYERMINTYKIDTKAHF